MKETPEYSIILCNVVKEARARSGITQSELADTIEAANRTVLNIENGRGNPKLEVLFPLVRELNIDARTIFYPETLNDAPHLNRLRTLVDGCTEDEAATLFGVMESVLKALRSRNGR